MLALLTSGVGLIIVVMLPIGWPRAFDGAVLLAGLALLVAWAIVDFVSAARRPEEPRWSFAVRRIGLALSHVGLIVILATTGVLFVLPEPPFWLWAVRLVGVIVYGIGELIELAETREERAHQRQRDREHRAYEYRRREAERSAAAAAAAEATAEIARTQAATIALDRLRRREEATRRRTGEGGPDRRP
ncbi:MULTISPECIES: hypothetical protein [Mumia]|uniref:hypothetical protein n=1 Tax=Mumia TaxID=1546255 RepID=UPI00141FFF0E|nr:MULTISPECIES: hypothetical protein [unclassified Mumia]QMW65654.1 hypothetical protein H4N58_15955 [Mumia sp. ZJ1417]